MTAFRSPPSYARGNTSPFVFSSAFAPKLLLFQEHRFCSDSFLNSEKFTLATGDKVNFLIEEAAVEELV